MNLLPLRPILFGQRIRCVTIRRTGVIVGHRPNPLADWARSKADKVFVPYFDVPLNLNGGDDTWPEELRYWIYNLSGKKDPTEIASQLERWYPNEPRLIKCARWLKSMNTKYPDRQFVTDYFTNWVAIWLIFSTILIGITRLSLYV